MNKILTVVGLIFHIIYYMLAILSLGEYEYIGYGVGKAFRFWIYAMLISLIIITVYLTDGIIAFVKNRKLFNILKLIFIIVTVPFYIFVGCSTGIANSIIWNIYFAIVFIIQIISLFVKRGIKQ